MKEEVERESGTVVQDAAVQRPEVVDYLGRQWLVGPAEGVDRNAFLYWAWETERLAEGKRYPRGRYGVRAGSDPLHP